MKSYFVMLSIQIILAVIVIAQTGCAGSTGWRFEIGVSPVKELSNTAGLKQERENAAKY